MKVFDLVEQSEWKHTKLTGFILRNAIMRQRDQISHRQWRIMNRINRLIAEHPDDIFEQTHRGILPQRVADAPDDFFDVHYYDTRTFTTYYVRRPHQKLANVLQKHLDALHDLNKKHLVLTHQLDQIRL